MHAVIMFPSRPGRDVYRLWFRSTVESVVCDRFHWQIVVSVRRWQVTLQKENIGRVLYETNLGSSVSSSSSRFRLEAVIWRAGFDMTA